MSTRSTRSRATCASCWRPTATSSDVWVAGEISNLSRAAAGHFYFTLKDAQAQLRCAFFRNRNVGLRTAGSTNGRRSWRYGSLSLYEQRGELSVHRRLRAASGRGRARRRSSSAAAQLRGGGLFDPERKRAAAALSRAASASSPRRPARCSTTSADVLARRWPLAESLLQPTPVQGAEAAPRSPTRSGRSRAQQMPDVIIVARGGGSLEDLWAFNEEIVARAIFGVAGARRLGGRPRDRHHHRRLRRRPPRADAFAAAELVAPDRAVVGAAGRGAAVAHGDHADPLGGSCRANGRTSTPRSRGARCRTSAGSVRGCRFERVASHRGHRRAPARDAARRPLRRPAARAFAARHARTRLRAGAASRWRGSHVRRERSTPGDRVELRLRDGARGARIEEQA